MSDYEKAQQILKEHGQEQLLDNYEKLSEEKKQELVSQILKLDFVQVLNLFQATENVKTESKVEPIPYVDKSELTSGEMEKYRTIGIEKIREGKVAVVTMAGGQRY